MDVERQAAACAGAQQEVLQLRAALAVAPIADPDQALARAFRRRRAEQAGVGGLVPDEDAAAPAPAAIDLGQRLAEGQHAVIAVEIEARGSPPGR